MMNKRKKGFSLIEMMVVIAIVAILVSIIVPAVNGYNTRAAAAANAANLRSVEGQMSTLMVTNPQALHNSLGQNATQAVNSLIGTITGIIEATPNWGVVIELYKALGTLGERLEQDVFYASDNELRLNGMIIEAPSARALSVDGIEIRKTTQMQVIVTENAIVATYAGMTADAFAAIAEGGKEGDYKNTSHTYVDSNKDEICDICGGEYEHTNAEIADGIIGGVVSGAHVCYDLTSDCICDDVECKSTMPHTVPSGSHVCSTCGTPVSECDQNSYDDTHHYCSICGQNKAAHTGEESCTVCGWSKSGCVTGDTLVTLANGMQKRIDAVNYGDYLLVWDFNLGRYIAKPAAALINMGEGNYIQTQLIFEDGTTINMLDIHGFFNMDKNRFVFINASNVGDYVGDRFAKANGNNNNGVKLVDYKISTVHTTAYSLLSAEHYNVLLADILTTTPIPGFNNNAFYGCWPMGENMTYDHNTMQSLINEHGLFAYNDVKHLGITYEQFINTNMPYVKVIIGEGVITMEQAMEVMSSFIPH